MNYLIKKARDTNILTKQEILKLLKDSSINNELFKVANHIVETRLENYVHLRALIEISNICKRNCMYCGLRRDNKNIKRYRLSKEQILEFARKAVEYGYKTIVMQGGEDDYFTTEKMSEIIKELKKLDVAITLSLGEKSYEEYKSFKEAGADRYLLRIETTDKGLYENLDPSMSHENRKNCLNNLKKLGYEVGSGCLIGLPGQTIESIADDILFFKEINADMIGIGPFIANSDTPLFNCKNGDFILSLKVMAITRLLLPDINIPATTAMETMIKDGRILALQSGANVIMPNVTEKQYKKLYLLYPGKCSLNEEPENSRNNIVKKIESIGKKVGLGYGFRGNGSKAKNS